MKLSDIKGERTFDVVADLIVPISNIGEDKEASALFRREDLPEGKTVNQFVLERIKKSMPMLLKKHKADLITILATIKGVSEKEYKAQLNLETLVLDVADLLTDNQFITFFTSAQSIKK